MLLILVAIAIVLWGFSVNPGRMMLTALTVFGAIVYAITSYVTGIVCESANYNREPFGETTVSRRVLRGALIVTLPVSRPAFVVSRLVRDVWVFTSFVAAMAVALLVVGVLSVGWINILIALGLVVGCIVLAIGIGAVAERIGETVGDRRSTEAARQHKLLADRDLGWTDVVAEQSPTPVMGGSESCLTINWVFCAR